MELGRPRIHQQQRSLHRARYRIRPQEKEPETQEKQLLNSFKGPELFKAYCATCHGKDAKGGGPMAASLKIAPADLTRIAERNGSTFPFLQIQKIISGEQPPATTHGTREMPVWGPIFSEVSWDQNLGRVRIYSLVRYLESIQVK